MTWAKYGVEFWDELADLGLSDAAVRTHAEAVGYVYRTENTSLRIPARSLRRFAGTAEPDTAAEELRDTGLWREADGCWVIVHHADVIRQSLLAQREHREQDKIRQRRHRKKKAEVSAAVMHDVTGDVQATQTDRHTDIQQQREPPANGKCIVCGEPARPACRTCYDHSHLEFAS